LLTGGLRRHFEHQVKLQARKENLLRCEKLGLQLEAADISQTANQAGILTAVGMVFTSLVITPFFTMWGRTKLLDGLLGKKQEAGQGGDPAPAGRGTCASHGDPLRPGP
ncbi:MAG: hypothetical protein IKH16_08975, partial [Selenomonadaceae bacterium]|nr:hypothetical protein [Selenomonadaceae bacterium]